MRLRVIRQRCEATLQEVNLPSPFTVSAFCDVVSERRGRRICLTPKENRLGPCGLWLAMDDADYVFYEKDTSLVHREHSSCMRSAICCVTTLPTSCSMALCSAGSCPTWM